MPKIHVDISLFTRTEAFGRISGPIDVLVTPQIGDYLSFALPKGGMPLPERGAVFDHLEVTGRTISANTDDGLLVSLADITVETAEDARLVMAFFEECHDLFGEPYEADE